MEVKEATDFLDVFRIYAISAQESEMMMRVSEINPRASIAASRACAGKVERMLGMFGACHLRVGSAGISCDSFLFGSLSRQPYELATLLLWALHGAWHASRAVGQRVDAYESMGGY